MKRLSVLILASVLAFLLFGCPPPIPPVENIVTGVTINGNGVKGIGASKEVTITRNAPQPVHLTVTVVYSGNPDLTENWVSNDSNIVSVGATTGEINGLVADLTGIPVTVTVGGKSDYIIVKVEEPPEGLVLGFNADKLEFYSLPTTTPFTPGNPVPATVVKVGNVITTTNTDGTFKETDTLQGSSYLLLQAPVTGAFEIMAAVKITYASAASDKYSCGVGMFVPNASGYVYPDSIVAAMAKRSKSTPDIRSLYSKSNSATADIGAGSPNPTGVTLGEYHILSLKRVGNSVTFSVNGETANVIIDPDDNNGAQPNADHRAGMWPTLAGSVKVGMYFAGVVADVEGFIVNKLDDTTGAFVSELFKSSDMPAVAIPVTSINTTGPAGSVESAIVDMNGAVSASIQLSTTYMPPLANIGTDITYSVQDAGDTNVTVDAAGLVQITAVGDGSATIVATSGNAKTDTYVITLVDSSLAVTSITIPATLNISVGQSLTLSPVTVLPVAVADKSVTWSSDSTAIHVDAATGVITVDAGTAAGTTGNITATSVHTPAVSSNTCVVTVVLPAGTPIVYAFPDANWGTNAAALLASTAIADNTKIAFLALAAATLHTDGLSYKSAGAGNLQFKYSIANGNAVNYNGSTIAAIPAVDAYIPGADDTAREAAISRYVSLPLNTVGTANVQIDVDLRTASSGSGTATCKVALVGSDYRVLATLTVDTTANTDYVFTWTGAKGSLSNVKIIFSREGAGGGGIDIHSITVTPQI